MENSQMNNSYYYIFKNVDHSHTHSFSQILNPLLALCLDGTKLGKKKNLRGEIEFHLIELEKKMKERKILCEITIILFSPSHERN